MTASCVPIKKMVYLQSEDDLTDKVFEYKKEEYRLQVNDILDVQVRSMNDEANKLFSVQTQGGNQAQATFNKYDLYYMTGYTIDQMVFNYLCGHRLF